MNTEITEPSGGWVLYDAGCALCRAWAARVRRPLRRRGFEFAPLQSPWAARRFGLDAQAPPSEMRLIAADGRNLGGADALVEIARRIEWARPIFLLSRLPGMMPLLRVAYRAVAARRHCLGGACALPRRGRNHRPRRAVTSAFFELP